jgi:hypothetical protein
MRFVERSARKLARQSFHGMLLYQARLQNKQAFLFRLVDIANEIFAMAASVSRARTLADTGAADAGEASRTADVFCRSARRKVRGLFRDLWRNDDDVRYRHGVSVLKGEQAWIEAGILPWQPPRARKETQPQEVAVEA